MSGRVQVQNSGNNAPPQLNFSIPKLQDIEPPNKEWDWKCAQLPTDVLLLTVKDPEFLNCYFHLENVFTSSCFGLGLVYFGEIYGEGKGKTKVSLVRCAMGAVQVRGALTVARNAISSLRPKAVICVGFCGGLNKEKTKLGDVVISATLSTYSSKKVTEDGSEVQRGIKANVSKHMGDLILNAANGWKAPLDNPEERKVKVHCNGEILSGPELVDFKGRQEELLKQHPAAIAIEMEGEGVYAAAFDLEVEWVVIKGISDFADGTKNKTGDWQPFASAMAASVVKNILKHPSVLRDWPHYKGVHNGDMQNKGYKWNIIIAVLVVFFAFGIGFLLLHIKNDSQKETAVPIQKHPGSSAGSEDLLHEALKNLIGGSGQISYKGRTIGYRAHGRIHSFDEPWVYDGTAWDIETNISVKKNHFKESEDAIKEAVSELIKKLKTEGIIQD